MSEPTPLGTDGSARPALHAWDYWRILWQGRFVLALVLGLSVTIAGLGTLFMAKRYRASALVEITLAPALVLGSDSERSAARMNFFEQENAFKTEFVRIKTREMLGTAIAAHDLARVVPELAEMKDPIDRLQRQLSADRVPQSNVASITVSWWDAKSAAALANAVAQTYVDSDLAYRQTQLRERAGRLDESAREKGTVRRPQLERELSVLRGDADLEILLSMPSLAENESLTSLHEALGIVERELESMSTTHGRNSPQFLEKSAEVQKARGQVKEAIAAAASGLETELRALGGNPDELPAVTDAASALALGQQQANARFEKDLRDKVVEQQLLMSLAEPRARVIDPARPPEKHYAPRFWLNLALALVVGSSLGGGLLFFREYLDTTVKTLDDVEKDLGLATLAVIPAYHGDPPEEVREAFQTLRTGLLFSSAGRKDRIVLITASAPREGKTTVATSLAKALAAAGESVIVVDADLRRPTAARTLGAGAAGKGLSNYLADASGTDWRGLVTRVGPNLDVLASGPVPPNPVSLLGLPRFASLLGSLKGAYDWVLVDSPPVSSVSDSLVLASLAELTVLVIRQNETDLEVVRRTVARLAGVNARVAGAVLTAVDMTAAHNRDYYYGRFFYGHYYGQDPRAAPVTKGWRGTVERASRKLLRSR